MYKYWIKFFFIFSFFIGFTFIAFNYICDPYGIFNNNWKGNSIRNHMASGRISKTYYSKRVMPQTALIGSSRVGMINVKDIEVYTKQKAYNLAMSGSSLYEQSMYAKFAIESLHVKQIIWGIDFFAFNPEAKQHFSFSAKRLGNSLYYQDYQDGLLSMNAFIASIKTLYDSLFLKPFSTINLDTGVETYSESKENLKKQGLAFIDSKIASGLKGYSSEKVLFNSEWFKNPNSIIDKFLLIENILDLAKKHDVKIIFYISPTYYEHLNLIYSLGLGNTYEFFKLRLSELTSYWDFNTLNSITTNKNHYWDNSHMREEIGTLLMKKMFELNTSIEPLDFGVFIKLKQE